MIQPDLPAVHLAPVTSAERIQALDVVRGFALFGIFLMNVEYFNRPTADMGVGVPEGLSAIDWFASWFVDNFVQGKFWTIFSMLFGMGFAVMLSRAQSAGRNFLGPYLRRILALAVFGGAHYLFLWNGDILFSYAVGAGALLILLFGEWKPIILAAIILTGIAFIPGFTFAGIYAGVLLYIGLLSTYVRTERRVHVFKKDVPIFPFALITLSMLGLIAAAVMPFIPDVEKDVSIGVTIFSVLFLLWGVTLARYFEPARLRGLRLGIGIYVVSFLMMIVGGLFAYLAPPEEKPEVNEVAQVADIEPKDGLVQMVEEETVALDTLLDDQSAGTTLDQSAEGDVVLESVASEPEGDLPTAADTVQSIEAPGTELTESAEDTDAAPGPQKTAAEKKADRKAEKKAEGEKELARRAALAKEEARIMSSGGYLEGVGFRARTVGDKLSQDAGFASILVAMFLIGAWFVQSGIMRDTRAHLPLFRKLALYGLPVGIGLGLLGTLIAVGHIPGDSHDGFLLAMGLRMLGNLPASLGYVGLVVVMLHSGRIFSKVSVLAPAGRMALTNYLMQSLISTYVFYGYGLGCWGLPRAWQLVFATAVFAMQVVLSQLWLKHFRYGPLEWFWRGFTYRETPAMRVS